MAWRKWGLSGIRTKTGRSKYCPGRAPGRDPSGSHGVFKRRQFPDKIRQVRINPFDPMLLQEAQFVARRRFRQYCPVTVGRALGYLMGEPTLQLGCKPTA